MVRVALVILNIVLMVQQTIMVALRIGGAHPDLLWLLPITAALLDGPETGAIVGFWSGLAFDLVLPDAVRAVCPGRVRGGLRGRLPHHRCGSPGHVAQAGGRGRGERRSGHAVRRARRNPRTGADGAGRNPFPVLVVGVSSVVFVLPRRPADAVGPGRGEPPPLPRARPGRQQDLVERTLRHSIGRPAPPQAVDPPRQQGDWRADAGGPRRGQARASTSPPLSDRPRRRGRAPISAPASSVSSCCFSSALSSALDAPGRPGEDLRRRRDPQPGARVSVPPPWATSSTVPAQCSSPTIRKKRSSSRGPRPRHNRHCRHGRGAGRRDPPSPRRRSTTIRTAPINRFRSRPSSLRRPCSTSRRISRRPGRHLRRWRNGPTPRGTTATHVLGYTGAISSSFLAAHPNEGYTSGQPNRPLGD